jgi:hypothetical protein
VITMAQEFVLGVVSSISLVCAVYRSAKVLRNRAAIEYRSVPDDESEPVASPVAASPAKRASRRLTLTPQQAAPLIAETDRRSILWLKYWVLVGLAQYCATLGLWYAVEARTLLCVLATLPPSTFSSLVCGAFEKVADPLLGGLMSKAAVHAEKLYIAVLAAASPILCDVSAAMLSGGGLINAAPPEGGCEK